MWRIEPESQGQCLDLIDKMSIATFDFLESAFDEIESTSSTDEASAMIGLAKEVIHAARNDINVLCEIGAGLV